MTISLKKNKKQTTLTLPVALSALLAAPLKEKLLEALNLKLPIIIDGQQLEHCHSLCLQLLYAAEQEAQQTGITLTYKNLSPILPDAARTLGLNLKFAPHR
jgi:anti-anti-sigma regulatory factor